MLLIGLQDLQTIDLTILTNGHVCDLCHHIRACSVPWKNIQTALGTAYQQDWSTMHSSAVSTAFASE